MFLEQSNEERSRSSYVAAITPLTSDADHLKRRIGLHGLLLPILYMSGVLFAFRRLRYPCGLLYGLLCVAGEWCRDGRLEMQRQAAVSWRHFAIWFCLVSQRSADGWIGRLVRPKYEFHQQPPQLHLSSHAFCTGRGLLY